MLGLMLDEILEQPPGSDPAHGVLHDHLPELRRGVPLLWECQPEILQPRLL